jgi:glycosyltransferase involved in cell wall biosynthesis
VGKVDREVLDAIAAAGLSDNVVLLGPLNHAEAVREQRSATLLLLPLRNDPQYAPILPGKLFEYLAARRPILGIGQEEGAMAHVLFSARAGITTDWENPAPMRAFIANAWRQHCEEGVPATTGDIAPYTRRNLTKALADLLEKVSKHE